MRAEGRSRGYVLGMDGHQRRDGHGGDGDARIGPAGSRGDIQVIARVAALLERLTASTPTLDARVAGEVLGVGRSTAHRYLASMEKAGLLQRQGAATYVLGPALVRLSAIAFAGRDLLETAGPVMRDLAERITGTIILGVWGGSAPVVARVERNPYQTTTVALDVGRSLELQSAQGILFTAFRDRGDDGVVTHPDLTPYPVQGGQPGETVLVARQDYEEGALKGLAVPVVTPSGELSATLAVLGFAGSLPDAEDERVIDLLIAGARKLQVS